jgi:tRNA(His) 5'-end guanylyltransferase
MGFFNSKLLKMTSVLASMTTAFFNRWLPEFIPEKTSHMPLFDARAWNIPTLNEASLYLLWREQDATRNSISMAAQTYYSHNQLMSVSSSGKQDLLKAKGINWNEYPDFFKRGTYVHRRTIEREFTAEEIENLPSRHEIFKHPDFKIKRREVAILEIPPLSKINNKADVLFKEAEVILRV